MYRAIGVVGIVVGLAVLSSAAPPPKAPPSMIQKVNQRIDYAGVDDPRHTLNDALEMVGNRYGVSFDINDQAFKMDGLMEVGRTPITDPTPIPPMKNARLSRVLRKILRRVPTPSGTTYYVHGDYIEITTGTFQSKAVWGDYGGPHLPLVNVVLEKSALEDAVHELADLSDFNIVVDPRAGDKAKTPVSARFLNTPLDTALRLLTDMVDLRAVHIDNVIYVTTKENAATLEARLEKEKTNTNPLDDNANPNAFRPRKGVGPPDNFVINPAGNGA
ncbi:MAG: hypothetical protein ACRELF_07390 [Gemmataceae bacterium]